MSLGHGASVVRDGLVFHMDMENVNKSWKGKPTTNLVPDPDFTQEIWDTWSGRGADSWDYTIFDHSTCAYTDLSINTGERKQLYRDITVSSSLTTFALSIEAYVTSDCDATSVFANQEFPFGNDYGSQSYDLSKKGTWQKLYAIRDNAYSGDTENTDTRYRFYFGTSNTTGTSGKIYFRKAQLEVGDFATPFVNGTRSNTEAIIDLTKNNTITVNNLSFDSDQTFQFDGTDDYISTFNTEDLFSDNQSWTISTFVNVVSNTTSGNGNGGILGNQRYFTETDPGGFGLSIQSKTNFVGMLTHDDGAGTTVSYQSLAPMSINFGNYEEITYVYDSNLGRMTAYRNGIQINQSNNTSYKWSVTNRDSKIGTSTQGGWGYYFNMKIGDLKVYNRALTATEVKRNFNAIRGRYGI